MADWEPGQIKGDRFELVGVLGRGGSSTVWLAEAHTHGVIHRDVAPNNVLIDPDGGCDRQCVRSVLN